MVYDEQVLAIASKQLFHGGAFLMSGKEEKNPMTIGWCQFGRVWNKPVLTLFVRHSRHSFQFVERDQVFTVSFPLNGEMKKELGFCGTKSARDVDKKKELGLGTVPARAGGVDGLSGCAIHIECRVLYQMDMAQNDSYELDETLRKQFYTPTEQDEKGDLHMVYFAEILDAYQV